MYLRRGQAVHFRLAFATLIGAMVLVHRSEAAPLDDLRWKKRILVIVGGADDPAVRQQRQIYESSVPGMSERNVVLAEALDDSERSRQIRSRVSANGKRFHTFLIGKDGNVAISSDKPFSAEYVFERIDAMPMRQDEMRQDEMRRAR